MQKIVPFLWFDNKAEEAMNFYVSTFKSGVIVSTTPGPDGKIMSGVFQIEGQTFYVLNGGPMFTFSPAISLFVNCDTQDEVDELWEKLLVGGTKNRCGWLQDKYGVSWQIIPKGFSELMGDPNPVKAGKVMQAMLAMTKINLDDLKKAAEQE